MGGKGGVGKTTLSASLGVELAARGHRTLLVSTDPAHSLGDALDADLAGGRPVWVDGATPLYALELDPALAREQLFAAARSEGVRTGVTGALGALGLGNVAEQLEELQLGELLEKPPPGFDEAVAIVQVVKLAREAAEGGGFTRVVVDTAPTGHTLRLLAMPDFLDTTLGKIIRLRQQIAGASSAVKGLFGFAEERDATLEKLETLQREIRDVQGLFQDRRRTEFVVVTIPTVLAVTESIRLAAALREQRVAVKRIVVNQVLDDTATEQFLASRRKDQARALELLGALELETVRSDLLDLEPRGVPALRYVGGLVWEGAEAAQRLGTAPGQRFVILGGKGGVGKTTMAASLAVHLASQGHKTLVVSTDPAHSLGDALDFDLAGGQPRRVEAEGLLWGLELDPEEARREFADLLQGAQAGGAAKGLGIGQVLDQLGNLQLGELLDNPPPGTDEAIALTAVLKLLEEEDFTRVVLDTAPTGHTLRLLTLPDFLDTALGKVAALRRLIASAGSAVSALLGGASGADKQVEKVEELQRRVRAVGALFRDQERTEFLVVTVPTLLAARESARLAGALRREGVPLRALVANQVLQEGAGERFLDLKKKDQRRALEMLAAAPETAGLAQLRAPLLDLEARGVPALKYVSGVVWDQDGAADDLAGGGH